MPLQPRTPNQQTHVVNFLHETFFKEYNEVLQHFNPMEQLELTEHFMLMMDCLGSSTQKKKIHSLKAYEQSADTLLIKYGSRFKPYTDQYFILYFLPSIIILKGYYSFYQIKNGLTKLLTTTEISAFAFLCKSTLVHKRIELLTSDAHKPIETVSAISDSNKNPSDVIEQQAAHLDYDLLLNITEQLSPFRDYFNREVDFNHCINAIAEFFSSGKAYSGEVIFVKGGIIRKLAYALGEIWRSTSNEIISMQYLMLYTRLFSIFNKQKLDESNIFCNNLYKYSISKT